MTSSTSAIVLLLLVSTGSGQLLPDLACTLAGFAFGQMGCLQEETLECKFFSLIFRLETEGTKFLCDRFICTGGYGQGTIPYTCVSSCPTQQKTPTGICPSSQECCSSPLFRSVKQRRISMEAKKR